MALAPGPASLPAPAAVLIVLDGWGIAPAGPGNAVALADTSTGWRRPLGYWRYTWGESRMVLSAWCWAVLRSPTRTVRLSAAGRRTATVVRLSAVRRSVASSMLVLVSTSPVNSQPSQVHRGVSQRR